MTTKTYKMRISGSGVARNGLDQIKTTKKAVEDAEEWDDVELLKEDLDLGTAEIAFTTPCWVL